MSRPRITNQQFNDKVNLLLENIQNVHNEFAERDTFNGPSLYFHQQSLEADDQERKLEMTYAALVAWGMHRMGLRGARMLPFHEFCESMRGLMDRIEELQNATTEDIEARWGDIEDIYNGIRVSANATYMVANSKVMAHYLPKIIAPIDRSYTLMFLKGNTNYNNDDEYQRILFKRIHQELYYPIVNDQRYIDFYDQITLNEGNPWYSSKMKGVDNLIIGAVLAGIE